MLLAFDGDVLTTSLSEECKTLTCSEARATLLDMVQSIADKRAFIVTNINTTGTVTGNPNGGRINGTAPAGVASSS